MNFSRFLSYFFLSILSFITVEQSFAEGKTAKQQELSIFLKDLESFTKVFGSIKQLYVDDVDNKELFDNAIKGMVGGLDPHSVYLKPKAQKDLLESATGKFGGLGIVISKKDSGIEVISPIDDTPAYRAGLQAGDVIIKIGDKLVRDMELEDGVKLMRGEPGTDIELTISRKNTPAFKVSITRAIITIVTVRGYLLEKDLGYLRISSFQSPTAKLLKEKYHALEAQNKGKLSSLILDLRNNPGGVLSGAVAVSDMFLPEAGKLVVYTKGKIKNANTEFKTTHGDMTNGIPMVVLINEGSASASEIVSGALQDHRRAIIMGKTSFGKGSVQTMLSLKEGYGLKITTARYYTPKGRTIQTTGIEPDIALRNISLENEKEAPIVSVREKDLEAHLVLKEDEDKVKKEKKILSKMSESEIIQSQKDEQKKADKETIKRLHKDYFVHEATNLLKALNVLNKK
jgi:carboxyl-terminal processing protease